MPGFEAFARSHSTVDKGLEAVGDQGKPKWDPGI